MSVISLSPDCLIDSAAIGAGGHDFTGIIIELRVPPVSILRPGMMDSTEGAGNDGRFDSISALPSHANQNP